RNEPEKDSFDPDAISTWKN
ncbi:unnamed protein product, partial [Didymodactylos carnosus]